METSETWLEALYECKRKHPSARLASVTDLTETKWITDTVTDMKSEGDLVFFFSTPQPWIGLYRSISGMYRNEMHGSVQVICRVHA